MKLAGTIDWSRFDEAYGRFYTLKGPPILPTRLMAGLHLLKDMEGLSDEAVCRRCVEIVAASNFAVSSSAAKGWCSTVRQMTRWRGRNG